MISIDKIYSVKNKIDVKLVIYFFSNPKEVYSFY
jgi:hypothetical protein